MSRNIHSWRNEDKPREKMKQHGADILSNAELLAIMLGSGIKGKNVVELSEELLDYVDNDLARLSELTLHDLQNRFAGIGEVKAMQILATLEFGRRRSLCKAKLTNIRNSQDAVAAIHHRLGDLNNEEFWIILLNRRNSIIAKECIARGGVSSVMVDVKLVMKPAIERLASAIILCHNHPSGSVLPSSEDHSITQKIRNAAKLMDITVIDHIIVTQDPDNYYSFADNGEI